MPANHLRQREIIHPLCLSFYGIGATATGLPQKSVLFGTDLRESLQAEVAVQAGRESNAGRIKFRGFLLVKAPIHATAKRQVERMFTLGAERGFPAKA
ncbi:MAG: hypothetical protein DMG57_37525 [Acidobacteria bacterium]|nr:MAG: hypothetical protein DMG57_37525 [Acidobacteriota bacterium]